MEILPVSWNSVKTERGTIVTLGNFDGIHLGHKQIFSKLIQIAGDKKLKPVVISFHPHPRELFTGQKIPNLTSHREKFRLLYEMGLKEIRLVDFTEAFSQLSPKEFVEKFLLEILGAEAVVIGDNHRFGKGAKGDCNTMAQLLSAHGKSLTTVAPIIREGEVVCSTYIRSLLQAGELEKANQFLGYTFSYYGKVVHGDGRGKKLGFPTANLELEDPQKILLSPGVYGGWVHLNNQKYPAVANIGKKPTFSGQKTQIEAHILDFKQDIYGQNLHLELNFFLRKEKAFSSGEELSRQIQQDLEIFNQKRIEKTTV